jgi:hypothetical protein
LRQETGDEITILRNLVSTEEIPTYGKKEEKILHKQTAEEMPTYGKKEGKTTVCPVVGNSGGSAHQWRKKSLLG